MPSRPPLPSSASWARPASPGGFDPSFGKGTAEIAGDIRLGTVDGLAKLAADAARIDLLHVPAGLARLLGNTWQGGFSGMGNLTVRFWEPGRQQVALAVDQAIDGDFRASAASTVEAVGIGVATGVALGELGAAAVEALPKDAGPKPGSSNPQSAGKRFPESVKEQARQESGGRCVFCGTETTAKPGPSRSEIDHSIPKVRGGDNSVKNAQNTCRTCNRQKGARTTREFKP